MNQLSAASVPGVSVSIVSDQKEIYSATFGVDGKTQSDYVLGNLTIPQASNIFSVRYSS